MSSSWIATTSGARSRAEPGEQEDHRIVATAEPSVGPDRRQHGLHLVGRQMAGQSGAVALRDAWNAERQVARCQPALEQVLKEVAQVGRWRLVPERRLARGQPLEEDDDVARSDRAHLDIGLAKAEVEEPIGEAPAVADRSLAQASLATEIFS
jgi:hypothetical protein